MKKILILVFNQMEDIEFVSFYDTIQRYGYEVMLYNVSETPLVTTKYGLKLEKANFETVLNFSDFDALYLPGGPGIEAIMDNTKVKEILLTFQSLNKIIISICAAPKVLAQYGLLKNKKVIAFNNQEIYDFLEKKGAIVVDRNCDSENDSCYLVKDGNIITGLNYEITIKLAKYTARIIEEEKEKDET